MADAWKLSTVTAAIAACSVTVTKPDGSSGALTIQDTGNSGATKFTPTVTQAACPVLQPRVIGFVTPSETFFTRDSYGADAAVKSVHYRLSYKFLFAPVAQGVELFSMYAASVSALVAVGLYFMANTNISGATEFLPRIETFEPQIDEKQTLFHGGLISFDVEQFLEA